MYEDPEKVDDENKIAFGLDKKYETSFYLIAIGIIFLCFTLYGLVSVHINTLKQSEAYNKYEPIKVKIVNSYVKATSRGSHGGSGSSVSYSPKVYYKYRVGGVVYINDTYSYFGKDPLVAYKTGRDYAQAVVDQYPKGSVQIGFYNPEIPKESVLNNNFPDDTEGVNTMILFFCSLGFWALFSGIIEIFFKRMEPKAVNA
jgi:hypothetical protein